MSADPGPMITAIVDAIKTAPNIGLVWPHDLWDRDDILNVIKSKVAGRDIIRAWWVSGPEMDATFADALDGMATRTWTFTIHGIEGLAPAWDGDLRGPGGDLVTLKTNAGAVTDALDADLFLAGSCDQAMPCTWPVRPEHRMFAGGWATSYIQIQKVAVTLA